MLYQYVAFSAYSDIAIGASRLFGLNTLGNSQPADLFSQHQRVPGPPSEVSGGLVPEGHIDARDRPGSILVSRSLPINDAARKSVFRVLAQNGVHRYAA